MCSISSVSRFRQKLVEVVSGDTAGDAGKLCPDQIAVAAANRAHLGIDFPLSGAWLGEMIQILLAGGADRHDGPVVEQNSQLFDVVDRFAAEQGMGATGVISDHSADGAAIVRGRIGREDELM